jgi:nitrate/nitrite transporter NarK
VAGCLVFANATNFAMLALGRALIGAGMAGILMGALKAFSQWFPATRYATISGLLIGLGSAGALVASTPLAWLTTTYGWRMAFVVASVAIAAAAAALVAFTRNTPVGVSWPAQHTDLSGLRQVFADRRFWRIALLVFFTNGVLLAFQGLWAGPYLNDAYAADAITRGNILFLLSLGVTIGFLTSGWLSDRIGLARIVILGTSVFIGTQLALAMHPPLLVLTVIVPIFGLSGGFSIMLLTQPRLIFPLAITGQATTAINLFAIGGTFLIQWWMGLIIDRFPVTDGHYPPLAYSAALFVTASGMFATLMYYLPLRHDRKRFETGLIA